MSAAPTSSLLRSLVLVVLLPAAISRPARAEEFSGDWLETNTLPRTLASAVYDPVRHRFLLFGGGGERARNDVWAYDLAGPSGWTKLEPLGTPPPPMTGQAAVYDPVGDRMIICEGAIVAPPGTCSAYNNTAWALDLSGQLEWKALTVNYGPIGTGATAIYDSRRNRVIAFGGFTVGCLCGSTDREVWSLNLGAHPGWTQLSPAMPIGAPPPSGRYEHVAVYDSLGDRIVVFGGDARQACSPLYLGDVWSLPFDSTLAWTKLNPSGGAPSARAGMVGVLDTARHRMVMFGGPGFSDAWSLSLDGGTSWAPLATSGPVPSTPFQGSAAYDVAGDRLVYQSGNQVSALSSDTQAWATLDQVPALPKARVRFSSVIDPVRRRLIVFGGYDNLSPRNDVWAMSLDSPWHWQQLSPSGTPPSQRYDAVAVYDPKGDRMVLFGGNGSALQDTWALHFSPTLSWEQLQPTGSLPYARSGASAIYDPVHSAMIVFGGFDGYSTLLNDVRSLSLDGPPAWTQLQPQGTPPSGRNGHVAIYDPDGQQMIVFGGGQNSGMANDTWALQLTDPPTWLPLSPAGTPPSARMYSAAFYDKTGHRMVLRGGMIPGGMVLSDLWALSLSPFVRWNALLPAGQGPSARCSAAAGYDSLLEHGVFFAGSESDPSEPTPRGDAWLLDLQDVAVPVPLALLSASVSDGTVHLEWYGPQAGMPVTVCRRQAGTEWGTLADAYLGGDGMLRFDDRDVVVGQRYGYRLGYPGTSGETFSAETWVDVTMPSHLALASLTPNPSSSLFAVTLSLPSSQGARLEVIDLRGRVVWERSLAAMAPGSHVVEIEPDFAAGMYVVRLSQGKDSISRKLVLIGR